MAASLPTCIGGQAGRGDPLGSGRLRAPQAVVKGDGAAIGQQEPLGQHLRYAASHLPQLYAPLLQFTAPARFIA